MTTRRTRKPALPAVRVADKPLAALLNKIKENIEIWSGARGAGLDRVVTHRELVALGLAEEGPAGDTAFAPITQERLGRFAVTAANLKDSAIATRAIAEQAVTIPVQTYVAGALTLTGSPQTAASAAIESSGAPIAVLCSALLSITSTNTSDFAQVEVSITQDGALTWGPHNLKSVIFSGASGQVRNAEDGFAVCIQRTPGEGLHTYAFRVCIGGTVTDVTGSAVARSLLLLETKR